LEKYNLSNTNLQSKKDLFANAAGICVYDKVGENTKLSVAIKGNVNTTNTRDEGTFSWEEYKDKLATNVANENTLQSKPLYLIPTFFYYTDADKDAKTNANINNQTVNFNYGKNINNQTTDCSVGIGVYDGSPKLVQPGAKYASASADYWASLYLGMLT
jgi:hypothetical protein